VKIGPYELKNKWILAPMAAVSEMPFRRIAMELGAGLAPTELVSAQGLFRLSARTMRYLRHDPLIEKPYPVQIFGGEPDVMAKAAVIAKNHGAQIIDINMGCPVPKVTRNGAGSALMCDPPRAAEIVRAIAAATQLPVTVKIRTGWDDNRINAVEMTLAMQEAGAAAVAIHGRTRAQGYAGKANWKLLAEVKSKVKVPVIGNGDVTSVALAHRMLEETGVDAVMIGRGALGNPWIFRELNGGPPPTAAERGALVVRHFDEHLAFVSEGREPNERAGVHSFRRHLGWYTHGLRSASLFRARVNQLEGAKQVRDSIAAFFAAAEVDHNAQGNVGDDDIDMRAAYG
jgi:nifR3 family TIM-barrel protein